MGAPGQEGNWVMANQAKLTARDREERFLVGRIARAAQTAKDSQRIAAGNIVAFPVMVVVDRPRAYGDQNTAARIDKADPLREYPFVPSHEPGPFPEGVTTVSVKDFSVGGVTLSYWFKVAVGCALPKRAHGYRLHSGTREQARVILDQLPKGTAVPSVSAGEMAGLIERAIRRGEAARNDLAREGLNFISSLAAKHFDRFTVNSLATPDDVRAGAHEHVAATVAQFCSPDRPLHVTWGRALFMSGRRDMNRALHAFDPEREDLRAMRAWIDRFRHLTDDPVELHRLLCRDATRARIRAQHPMIAAAEVDVEVDRLEKAGCLDSKVALAKVRRVMATPQRTVVSLDAPLSADGSGGTMADVVAGQDAQDPTEYSLSEAALVLCGDNLMMADLMRPFFHCMGLASATDDAGRPRALPSSGPVGRLARELFGPFLAAGEVWTKAEHRDNARTRAYAAFTEGGRLRPAEEITGVWNRIYGQSGMARLASAAAAAITAQRAVNS